MESFSAALLAPSAAPLRGWRCPRPNGAQPGLLQHPTGIAHRLPPRRPLAAWQERPAADDCNEAAGSGEDPTIVVRPPRTVLVEDSEAIAQHQGRPCGRPPAAAVLGRQRPRTLSELTQSDSTEAPERPL
jgi:hypothetical protein